MMDLQFKTPTLDDKARILTFRREFNAVFDAMHGANELNAFMDGGFVGWINYINAPAGTQWFEYQKVADSTYIALIDDVVVAIVHIRHTLNDVLLQQGGHVGYSTHPAYQGRGIATRVLAFAVRTLNEMGVYKVLVTCQHDNLASARVIEKNGGILENILTKSNGVQVSRYWIGER